MSLEKKVQKQDLKILELMECIDSVLERIDDLEDLADRRDKRIWALEDEVEELKLKVCCCKGKEKEVAVPEEVKKGHRMCLKRSDPCLYRRPLSWSMSLRVLILMTRRT